MYSKQLTGNILVFLIVYKKEFYLVMKKANFCLSYLKYFNTKKGLCSIYIGGGEYQSFCSHFLMIFLSPENVGGEVAVKSRLLSAECLSVAELFALNLAIKLLTVN